MHRSRHAVAVVAVAGALSLSACDDHTVAIRFDPEVGDEYRLESHVDTEIERTVDGKTDVDRSTARLEASETVTAVDDNEIAVEVTVERDGAVPRRYEVRFGPRGHLSTIDLVEGVPAGALGLNLTSGLPSDLSSPPAGPLEPGAEWSIEREITNPETDETVTVRGTGRLESLGVADGVPIASVVVDVAVPLRSVETTTEGRVTLRGRQSVVSRTRYDLDTGTARHDRTDIRGEIDVLVEPPKGIDAPPVPGTIRYEIEMETERVPAT